MLRYVNSALSLDPFWWRAADYTYDDAYRLTDFDINGTTHDRTFTYDRNGNRQTRGDSTYLYGWEDGEDSGLNYLKSAHSTNYKYDLTGNMTKMGSDSFYYDYRKLCTSVSGTNARTYAYDAAGRRVKAVQGANTYYYIYDGNRIIAEYTGSTLTARYIYGHGSFSGPGLRAWDRAV